MTWENYDDSAPDLKTPDEYKVGADAVMAAASAQLERDSWKFSSPEEAEEHYRQQFMQLFATAPEDAKQRFLSAMASFGMLSSEPVRELSADEEAKVDEFVDFLKSQLKKD